MRRKNNIRALLNMGEMKYANLTRKCGEFDMPSVMCNIVPKIDYIAGFSRPSRYFQTKNTCVSFFEYDNKFDGINGLWNSIHYDNKGRQRKYVKRFEGVKYFIAPDYSQCGDAPLIENVHRLYRSRIVSIWLTMEIKAVVIPLVSCANLSGMKYALDGLEDCTTVAFNAMGILRNKEQSKILTESVKYTVNSIKNLRSIIVYSTSMNTDKVRKYFQYAIDAGLEVQIPNNVLQTRNRLKGGGGYRRHCQ